MKIKFYLQSLRELIWWLMVLSHQRIYETPLVNPPQIQLPGSILNSLSSSSCSKTIQPYHQTIPFNFQEDISLLRRLCLCRMSPILWNQFLLAVFLFLRFRLLALRNQCQRNSISVRIYYWGNLMWYQGLIHQIIISILTYLKQVLLSK